MFLASSLYQELITMPTTSASLLEEGKDIYILISLVQKPETVVKRDRRDWALEPCLNLEMSVEILSREQIWGGLASVSARFKEDN